MAELEPAVCWESFEPCDDEEDEEHNETIVGIEIISVLSALCSVLRPTDVSRASDRWCEAPAAEGLQCRPTGFGA